MQATHGEGQFTEKITQWIFSVSQHPYPPPPVMYVSSEEEEAPPANQARYVHRPQKRPRADTALSDDIIPENLRIVINRRDTPFEPSSPDEQSASPSESHGSRSVRTSTPSAPSEAGSTTTSMVQAKVQDKQRRSKTAHQRLNAENQETERQACIARIATSTAKDLYAKFEEPQLIPIVGKRSTHYGFKCKYCPDVIPRGIPVMETSNLANHATRCAAARKHSQDLLSLGVTSSAIRLTYEYVRELYALWFAQHARPFILVEDDYYVHLLHPDARKHMPSRATISKDVKLMYDATQQEVIKLLASGYMQAHKGVFHLALDLCQSANGFDYLGLVVFWASAVSGQMKIERLVVECLNFEGAHTGVALSKTVLKVLRKFGIEDRVWGVVCDNASNNDSMLNLLGNCDLKRMKGPKSGVHCAAHVLNLAAQAILAMLRTKRRDIRPDNGDEDEDEDEETEFNVNVEEDPDADKDDDGRAVSHMLIDEELFEELEEPLEGDIEKIELPPIEPGSLEEKQFSKAATAYWKLAKVAHKLRYCPAAKKTFQVCCQEKGVDRPHNLRRDVCTRWGSTSQMFDDGARVFAALLPYQQNRKYTPLSRTFRADDYDGIQEVRKLLKPLAAVTEILCRASVPSIAELIIHFDCLTQEFTDIALDEERPLWARHGAVQAIRVLNKYYGKTSTRLFPAPSMRMTTTESKRSANC
ncbi:unnamed protein product [Rhizoctonia solani]|uniref:AC transposase n=1 Tax=Rhizoctonia solani TaxID=456999 RepID=A0A8H3HXL3_9AGAM|nr:unnamed protein product [Rhizoctonia solani]